jgi:hypothetical protein
MILYYTFLCTYSPFEQLFQCQDSPLYFLPLPMFLRCTALWLDARFRIMQRMIECKIDFILPWHRTVHRRRLRDDRTKKNRFAQHQDSVPWWERTFSIWLMWFLEVSCITATRTKNKRERQICTCTGMACILFVFIEFWYYVGPCTANGDKTVKYRRYHIRLLIIITVCMYIYTRFLVTSTSRSR